MWLLKRPSFIALGIDISRYSIELFALTSERDVVAYERLALEEDVIQNDGVAKKDIVQTKLGQALAKLYMRTGNLHGVRVVVNIPEQHTYTHYFDVPVNLLENDLSAYLQKEAETVIPLEPREMTATYIVLEKPGKNQVTKRVLFVGTRKDITQGILGVLHAVGIDAVILDIESMALMRSFLPPAGPPEPVLILDGGSETSSMHIFEGHSMPLVSVAYAEGGVHVTRRIAEKLGLSFDEAEKIKCAYGLLKAPRVPAELDAGPKGKQHTTDSTVAEDVSSLLHDWYQPLLSEVHKTIAFYEAGQSKRVSRVILSGGAALLPGIVPYLTAWMERSVHVGNPLLYLRNSEILGKERPSVLYATAIGLALRGADVSATGIDFTHGTIAETKKKDTRWRQWTIFTTAILAAILGAFAVYNVSLFFDDKAAYEYERAEN